MGTSTVPRTRAKHGLSHSRSMVRSRMRPCVEEERQLSKVMGGTGPGGSGSSPGQQFPAQLQLHGGTTA